MSKGSAFAAEGKGYAKAARKKEELGKDEEARQLYLQSAKSFLEASKLSDTVEEKTFRKQMAQTFYGKAVSLKQVRRERIRGRAGETPEGLKEMLPIEKPSIKFSDVGGLYSVKEEIKKAIVYPFEHPEIYEMYGKKAGEGILLYGPPGCGKTFIARAAAGECGASFLSMKISDILSKWLGDSEKNIRMAFDTAGRYAPAILFFDEIDALGGKRSGTTSVYAKRVVNELLVALDGLEGPKEKLLTLAATNEPWAVDAALRRPGRFSKLILVPQPDLDARVEIFKLHMRERPLGEDVNFQELAKLTDMYSSADIAQICNEAADIPLEEALKGKNPRKIMMNDFLSVLKTRKSSLPAWFRMAHNQIKRSGEEDLFEGLMKIIEKQA